jgi:hypothetical protein
VAVAMKTDIADALGAGSAVAVAVGLAVGAK